MRRQLVLLLAIAAAAAPGDARAEAQPQIQAQPGSDGACAAAAAVAERSFGLPEGLLLAIGRVESGRTTSLGHQPWPWSINSEGVDTVTDSAATAIAAVRMMQARGLRSIDTGCFQINLMFHPDAFGSLEEAFDPSANALYAARFLTELHRRSGDWGQAVAAYHSATPWRGENYRQLVWRAWSAPLLPDAPIAGAAGMAREDMGFSTRFMRVFVPAAFAAQPPAIQPAPVMSARSVALGQRGGPVMLAMSGAAPRGRLPVVYRPGVSR